MLKIVGIDRHRLAVFMGFITIFLNSQIVMFNVHNPLSISGAFECFIATLLIYSALHFTLMLINKRIHTIDCVLAIIIGGMWCSSAIASYLYYEQPLYYGLIEERRVLALLAYFPLVQLIRKGILSSEQIVRYVFICALLAAGLQWLIKFNLVSVPLSHFQEASEFATDDSTARKDRMSIAVMYLVFALFYGVAKGRRENNIKGYLWALFFLLTLFFVTQTRQITIASIASVLTLSLTNKKFRVYALSGFLIIGIISAFLANTALLYYPTHFSSLLDLQHLQNSARYFTLNIIFNELIDSWFMPHGSLSALWQNGFSSIYTPHFFLSDVGIFGTFFRYGIFAIPLLLYAFKVFAGEILRMPKGIERNIVISSMLMIFFLLPTSAPLEHRGDFTALILALAVGKNYRQTKEGQ